MSLEEYLSSKPSRREVMEMICNIANANVLPICDVPIWDELSDKFDFTVDDFYDDQDSWGEYEKNYIGLYNWTVK